MDKVAGRQSAMKYLRGVRFIDAIDDILNHGTQMIGLKSD